jgi:threonine aldolase
MVSRLVVAAVIASAGCASSASQADVAATPVADCGGMYAITVRNEGNTADAFVSFTDAALKKPAQSVGRVAPKDEMTFFFRSAEPPTVWVEIDGARVFVNDRTAQQRARVRMALRCDSP